jgi:predicted nucleic acid-binding protein
VATGGDWQPIIISLSNICPPGFRANSAYVRVEQRSGTIGIVNPIALDSNCFTYLILGLANASKPQSKFASEQISLARLFFYLPSNFALEFGPTVKREYERIRDVSQRNEHESWAAVLFHQFTPPDPLAVIDCAARLSQLHNDLDDCRIVAECWNSGISTLLTYDGNILKNLAPHSTAPGIKTPTEFWNSLSIPKGSPPTYVPMIGNPLRNETWWRW